MSVPQQPSAAPAGRPSPDELVQPSQVGIAPVPRRELSRRATAWALWDWGSASFNAVVTTFVFSRYIASDLFVDPAVVEAGGDGLTRALADNASVVAWASRSPACSSPCSLPSSGSGRMAAVAASCGSR